MPRGIYPRKRRGRRRQNKMVRQDRLAQRTQAAYDRAMTAAANSLLDAARINVGRSNRYTGTVIQALSGALT